MSGYVSAGAWPAAAAAAAHAARPSARPAAAGRRHGRPPAIALRRLTTGAS